MSKPFIVVGDKIDHGGAVASSTATTDINGQPVARINDKVTCSQHGDTVIVTGDPTTIIDGQPVARHGDKTACGATLIAAQMQVFVDSGGGSTAGNRSGATGAGRAKTAAIAAVAIAAAARESSQFDEQIQFLNANGAELANVDYRLELENGEILQGVTDAGGKTGRVITGEPTSIVRAQLTATNTSCCSLHHHQAGAATPLAVPMQNATTSATDIGSSTKVVQTPASEARGLTSGESAMARLVFANAIDYDRVKVHNGEYLWFGLQPDATAMTPNGEMYFNEKYFLEDFSTGLGTVRHWFMHEMVHIWQYQLGYPVKARGAIRIGLPYQYTLSSDKRLCDYNMEAQGNILADYYMLKFEGQPGLLAEMKYGADPGALPLFETVLSDFLKNPRSAANLP